MTKPLERAASVLLRHVDASMGMSEHASLRAKIVENATSRQSSRRPVIALWVLAPVAAALAIAVLVFALRTERTSSDLTFAVAGVRGSVGAYLVATDTALLPVRFSEGSVVELQPASRGRVSSISRRGASVVLESGRARCEIVHLADADWSVTAGPYSVQVKGTSFEIAWDALSGTLELQMVQGRVVLRGPGVESGIELSGTQRFVSHMQARGDSSAPAASTEVFGTSDSARSQDAAVEIRIGPGNRPDDAAASSPPGSLDAAPSAAPAAPRVSWSELASRGDYATILAEADARGIDAVLGSGSESDLAALSDAARFRGRQELASRALNATRSRFPGTSRAASAAYVLGRMADDAGQAVAAIGWYERYLAEAPAGPLAPEAMGRRMLLLRKTGNLSAGRQAAEQYLQRYPKGPYAGVAREMTAP